MLQGGIRSLTGGAIGGATGGAAAGKPLSFDDVSASAGGGWDTWLVSLLNVLTQMRGASDQLMPLTGIAMPLITGVDTMSCIALLTPHIALACKRLTGINGPVPVAFRDPDTLKSANTDWGPGKSGVDWVGYLAATADPADGSIRGGNVPAGITSLSTGVADTQDIANAISLVKYWQACIDQSVLAIQANGANGVGAVCQPLNISAFFTALQHTTSMLDQVAQDAASSTGQIVQQALIAAKNGFAGLAEGAANLAGDIAARAANEAGTLAGNVAAGFFSQIGAIGYAVVAIVIYMAFYR